MSEVSVRQIPFPMAGVLGGDPLAFEDQAEGAPRAEEAHAASERGRARTAAFVGGFAFGLISSLWLILL